MIDHFTLSVRDLAKSRAFYQQALAPLGYRLTSDYDQFLGFGDTRPYFWLKQGPSSPTHIAFAAKTRAEVDAFYRVALKAGAKDNGPPGPRPHYHPNYYGGFVLDPDGNPIEAVCHAAEAPTAREEAILKKIARKAAPPRVKKRAQAKTPRRPARKKQT